MSAVRRLPDATLGMSRVDRADARSHQHRVRIAAITEGVMTTQHRDLHGLKALVTGATSGLGRAIALQLARDGADVAVHGRDATRGIHTVEESQSQGGSAHFVAADL